MASIYPFIAENMQAGQQIDLKLHEILWKSVGRGDILKLDPYEVDVTGQLSIILYHGDLRIRLQLSDQAEAAHTGPCVLQINSHVDPDAVYHVRDGVLSVDADFDGRRAGIRLSRDRGGKMTRCELAGYISLTAYLQTAK
jgi:hypothetical protein